MHKNAINSDVQKQSEAAFLHAGYGVRSTDDPLSGGDGPSDGAEKGSRNH
jgi:hypothetical protein